jgi:hypothetical protein
MSRSQILVPDTINLPGKLKAESGDELSEQELTAIIIAHHAALRSGEGVLKDRQRNAVTSVRQGNDWFCVKEYRTCGLPDRIKDCLRRTRVRRAWNGAIHLHKQGVSSPEPVSQVKKDGKNYFITRFINGAIPLNLLLRKRFSGYLNRTEITAKRMMVKQLGQWLRSIHDLGIYHDDWSSKNILATQHKERWIFHLLDMESVLPRKRLTYRRRVKNLSQISDAPFGISPTDRMRFMIAYAGDDKALTRGKFPGDIIAAQRLRAKKRTKIWVKSLRRKAKLKRKMEKMK